MLPNFKLSSAGNCALPQMYVAVLVRKSQGTAVKKRSTPHERGQARRADRAQNGPRTRPGRREPARSLQRPHQHGDTRPSCACNDFFNFDILGKAPRLLRILFFRIRIDSFSALSFTHQPTTRWRRCQAPWHRTGTSYVGPILVARGHDPFWSVGDLRRPHVGSSYESRPCGHRV